MTKEEIEKIERIAIIGLFLIKHLIDHHDFSEEEAKDFVSPIAGRISNIKEGEMEKMIKESFDTKK